MELFQCLKVKMKVKKCFRNIALFIWYRIIGAFFRVLPIQKNKIVFVSFFGKGYSDNPKYIAEELLKNYTLNLQLIWMIKENINCDFPQQIHVIKRGSLGELYHLSTAKVWVDNGRKHFGVKKRKRQCYMQTWHGDVGLKLIEKDINPDIWYKTSAKHDSKMIDVLISGSKWMTENYKRCFWYDGVILEIGMPKNDFWLFEAGQDQFIKNLVYSCFKLGFDKKIVLYAPTFRDKNSIDAYDIKYEKLIDTLEKYWGGKWVVMIRLHPSIEQEAVNISYNDRVINASTYPDINELLLASSLLISDYSSCLFDAVYNEKPSIIYASDVVDYEKNRGFALTPTEWPVLFAQNNIELESRIKEFKLSRYIEKCKDFLQEYGIVHCRDASKKAAEWIINNVLHEEN